MVDSTIASLPQAGAAAEQLDHVQERSRFRAICASSTQANGSTAVDDCKDEQIVGFEGTDEDVQSRPRRDRQI